MKYILLPILIVLILVGYGIAQGPGTTTAYSVPSFYDPATGAITSGANSGNSGVLNLTSKTSLAITSLTTPDNVATGGTIYISALGIQPIAVLFANLGTPSNGTFTYCSDCTVGASCSGSGTGAFAKRLNGAWVCN